MPNSSAAAIPHAPLIRPIDVRTEFHGLIVASVDWIQAYWLQILIALLVGAAIVAVLHAARRLGKKLCDEKRRFNGWGKVFGRAVVRTGNIFMIALAAKLVVGYTDAPREVARTIDILFTIATVFQFAVWAREIILGTIEHRASSEHYSGEALLSAMGLIRMLVTVTVFAIALVVVLDNLGINVTGLVAGLGVGGIAIGLAAQGIFADLFAALAIIFDRPFRRGDAISYDQTSGNVEAIGLKSTRIRGLDGEERIISNKNLLNKEILNNTQRNHRRSKLVIGVTYATPPETCSRIPDMLKAIVLANDKLFVRAGFIGFGASSLDFEVQFDSHGADYASFYDGRTAIGIAILKKLNDEKIDIAFPTQVTMTAAPDGSLVMPYPKIQPVRDIDHEVRT